jgi:hypothetical protein
MCQRVVQRKFIHAVDERIASLFTVAVCVLDSYNLKTEAVNSSETSVNFYTA